MQTRAGKFKEGEPALTLEHRSPTWLEQNEFPQIQSAPRMKKSDVVIVNISGRGDKDMGILRENLKF